MTPGYEPTNIYGALGHVVEECGEVSAAIGKSLRFGLDSVNPELPPEKQERNVIWIRRELEDLGRAIITLRGYIDAKEKAPVESATPKQG